MRNGRTAHPGLEQIADGKGLGVGGGVGLRFCRGGMDTSYSSNFTP
jgi:hypothetical protein